MRKFSILHLSDLHIQNVRNKYSTTLTRLIADVKKETTNIESLILVVTGDIIDQANYDKASDVALDFFDDLCKKLNGKIKKVFFTPGNHDKTRPEHSDLFRKYFTGQKYESLFTDFERGDWKNVFSHSFDNYINLLERVSERIGIEICTDLYYCDLFEINDCIVRINSINSSVSSFDDNDYGELHIGKYQIDKIEQEYEKNRKDYNKEPDVSITIMHHPTFWLCKEEYDEFMYCISSKESLATDVLLRGHTHNRSLENNYSLYSSFSTFVTGVGRSDKKNSDHPQRYSIYSFMCDLNLIEIVMKASSEKGFIPDYSAYVSETDESRKKIHFPMHIHDFISDTYLKVPLANNDFQPIFPTKDISERIYEYSKKMFDLKERLSNILFSHKEELLSTLERENCKDIELIESFLLRQGYNELNEDKNSTAKLVLDEHKEVVNQTVRALFLDFCTHTVKVLFEDFLNAEDEVRVQFRVFNKANTSHEGLALAAIKGKKPQPERNINSVPWKSGLIEKSYSVSAPLIYSLNKEHINDRLDDTNWKDYYTYSPNYTSNSYYDSRSGINYPAITFGINCDFDSCYSVLETLSLLPFQKIIDDFLMDIQNSFNFSFYSLIKLQ